MTVTLNKFVTFDDPILKDEIIRSSLDEVIVRSVPPNISVGANHGRVRILVIGSVGDGVKLQINGGSCRVEILGDLGRASVTASGGCAYISVHGTVNADARLNAHGAKARIELFGCEEERARKLARVTGCSSELLCLK